MSFHLSEALCFVGVNNGIAVLSNRGLIIVVKDVTKTDYFILT